MKIEAYLGFNGQCEEAMEFYRSVLGGELTLMRWGEAPPEAGCPELPQGYEQKVMHGLLKLPEAAIMACDVPPGMAQGSFNDSVSLSIATDTADEARRVFEGLAQDGQTTMQMQKTFWAETFGMLTDKYGVRWMVSGGLCQME